MDSAKIAQRKIEQKKKFLERLKQKEEMKRASLQDLKAEELDDQKSSELAKTGTELGKREEELQKRKAELVMMFRSIAKVRDCSKTTGEICQGS